MALGCCLQETLSFKFSCKCSFIGLAKGTITVSKGPGEWSQKVFENFSDRQGSALGHKDHVSKEVSVKLQNNLLSLTSTMTLVSLHEGEYLGRVFFFFSSCHGI